MNEQNASFVRNNWALLKQRISVKDGLYDELYQKHFIEMEQLDRIKKLENPIDQVGELLRLVNTDKKFNTFCLCLEKSGQGHLVERIQQPTGDNTKSTLNFKEPRLLKRKDAVRLTLYQKLLEGECDNEDIWNSIEKLCIDEIEVNTETLQQEKSHISPEDIYLFCGSLNKCILIRRQESAITFYLTPSNLFILDGLDEMHKNDYLEYLVNLLVTDRLKEEHSVSNIHIGVHFSEIDYLTCWKYHAKNVLPILGHIRIFQTMVVLPSPSLRTQSNFVTLKLDLIQIEAQLETCVTDVKETLIKILLQQFETALTMSVIEDERLKNLIKILKEKGFPQSKVTNGSILLQLDITSLQCLENLSAMMESSELYFLFEDCFLTPNFLTAHGVHSAKMKLSLDPVEYLQTWKDVFSIENLLPNITATCIKAGLSIETCILKVKHDAGIKTNMKRLQTLAHDAIQLYLPDASSKHQKYSHQGKRNFFGPLPSLPSRSHLRFISSVAHGKVLRVERKTLVANYPHDLPQPLPPTGVNECPSPDLASVKTTPMNSEDTYKQGFSSKLPKESFGDTGELVEQKTQLTKYSHDLPPPLPPKP